MPETIHAFMEVVPPAVADAVTILGGAVTLTDEVACRLLRQCGPSLLDAARLTAVLHECEFVVEGNSEWQFTSDVRAWLGDRLHERPGLARTVHAELLHIADTADPAGGGETVPAYLTWAAGRAYHTSELVPEEGLAQYARAYTGRRSGDQWLLRELVDEQQRRGLLHAGAVELVYINGMSAYREGRWREAERALRRVVASQQRSLPVAIAQHLCGLIEAKRHHRFEEAEALFLASLALRPELGDRRGEAHVQHSLANLLAHPQLRERWDEAEELYDESSAALEEMGDLHGAATVQHSLANLLARPQLSERWGEAEELYDESLAALVEMDDVHGAAEVRHSLARLLSRREFMERWDEAEELYNESLAALVEMGDLHGVAEVQHSLANLLARPELSERWGEAEELYRKSLDTLLQMDDRRGVAQVSLNLAKLLAKLGETRCLLDALHYARMSASANAALGFTAFQRQAERLAAAIESQLSSRTD